MYSIVQLSGMTPKKVWIILPGGGVRGIYQLGFIEGLLEKYGEDGIVIERVYGTSIGAILSPLIATMDIKAFRSTLDKIKTVHDVFQPWNWFENALKIIPLFKRMGAYKRVNLVDKVISTIRDEVCNKDEEKVRAIYDRCNVVAWDVVNKRETWFTGADLPFGMRASSALPVAVPPVDGSDFSEGTLFADGGVTELFPLGQARADFDKLTETDKKDLTLLLIDCDGERMKPMKERPKNAIAYIGALMTDTIAQLAMRELEFVSPSSVRYVDPAKDSDIFDSVIDINPKKMRRAYEAAKVKGLTYDLSVV
jgi:predicted acylesterase/phospholipase RssA